MGKKTMII